MYPPTRPSLFHPRAPIAGSFSTQLTPRGPPLPLSLPQSCPPEASSMLNSLTLSARTRPALKRKSYRALHVPSTSSLADSTWTSRILSVGAASKSNDNDSPSVSFVDPQSLPVSLSPLRYGSKPLPLFQSSSSANSTEISAKPNLSSLSLPLRKHFLGVAWTQRTTHSHSALPSGRKSPSHEPSHLLPAETLSSIRQTLPGVPLTRLREASFALCLSKRVSQKEECLSDSSHGPSQLVGSAPPPTRSFPSERSEIVSGSEVICAALLRLLRDGGSQGT